MKAFNTFKEVIENTKLLTPDDYTHVIMIAGRRKGKIILDSGIHGGKVVRGNKENNIEFNVEVPPYGGESDKNWEVITIINCPDIITTSYGSTRIVRHEYRYTKDKVSLAKRLLSRVSKMEVLARTSITYKTFASTDTADSFSELMDEL